MASAKGSLGATFVVSPVVPALHDRLTTTQANIQTQKLVRVTRGKVTVTQAESVTSGDAGKVDSLSFHALIVARTWADAKHIHGKVIVVSPCPARVYVGAAAPAKMAGP